MSSCLPAVAPQSEGWSEAKDYRMVVISNFPSFQILVVNAGLTSNAYFAGPAEGYVGHGSFLHGCMTVVVIQKLIRCSLSNTKSIPASASSFFLNMSPRSRNASVSAISALITTVCPYWSLNEIFCVRNSIAPEDCDDGDEGWSGIEARGS